ncbi:MAG: hypothetical protein MJA29_11125 [Candidatus Omnitrophica bacterium]|nr:hypothetical protein [Candidatus Omnitrophota bacterium]
MLNKLSDLEYELSLNNNYIIIAVTETWFKPGVDNSILNFAKNYQIYRTDRSDRLHGGVMLMVNSSIISVKLYSKCFYGYIELLVVKLIIIRQILIFILIYRSPTSPNLANQECIDFIRNLNFGTNVLITGDFNMPGLYGGDSEVYSLQFEEFENLFAELGLIQKVTSPTRYSLDILDLVLCNDDFLITNLLVDECFSSSDDCMVKFDLNIPNEIIAKNNISYDFYKANYFEMIEFLHTIDWDNLLLCENATIDDLWTTFCNVLDYAIYKFVPIKLHKSKFPNKWSSKTRKSYLYKKKAWRRYKNCKNEENLRKFYEASYNAKSNANNDIKFNEYKILNSGNIKTFYSFINSKLASRNSIPPLLKMIFLILIP